MHAWVDAGLAGDIINLEYQSLMVGDSRRSPVVAPERLEVNDDMAQPSHSPSPLDPFLARFLALVATSENGFQPGPESDRLARGLEVPRPFVDTLFTSARTRGLIKPMYGRGNKVRWKVSPTGEALIRDYPE